MGGVVELLIAAVGGLLMPLIFVIVVVCIIKSAKNKVPKDTGQIHPYTEGFTDSRIMKATTFVSKDKRFTREAKRSGVKKTLIEDNSDDFLAKQLKEEQEKISYVNDMFDLKVSHSEHCDADSLKKSHVHDDRIDTGSMQ